MLYVTSLSQRKPVTVWTSVRPRAVVVALISRGQGETQGRVQEIEADQGNGQRLDAQRLDVPLAAIDQALPIQPDHGQPVALAPD